jgi:hypothetical protein
VVTFVCFKKVGILYIVGKEPEPDLEPHQQFFFLNIFWVFNDKFLACSPGLNFYPEPDNTVPLKGQCHEVVVEMSSRLGLFESPFFSS